MVKKVHLQASGEFQTLTLASTHSGQEFVFLRSIQIKGQDPSDLVMEIEKRRTWQSDRKVDMFPLVTYRQQFFFQNDIYILDVGEILPMQDMSDYFSVKIAFKSIDKAKSVDVAVYYFMVDRTEYFQSAINSLQAQMS